MLSNIKRLSSAALALMLLLSFSGCKKSEKGTDSSDVEYVYEYVKGSGTASGSENTPNTESVDGTASGGGSSTRKNSGTGSNKSTAGGGSTGSKVDASKYRGTTVVYATWKDPDLNEDGVAVKSFKKKYGIDVKIDMINQDTYIQTVASRIASGNSPDILFCTGTFPIILQVMEPIDAMQLDKSDSFWDQSMFKLSTVNGKTYLANAVGNIWNEVDCLFYSKSLLKKANLYTPAEYAKQGKWTWDTLEHCMREVGKLGSKYTGGTFEVISLLGSASCSPFTYKNGKFVNDMDNKYTDAMKRVSTWFKEGIASTNVYDFRVGNAGYAICNAFGLKKTGFFYDSNWADIGCYYIPDYSASVKAKPTGIVRGWGLAKGAKNPVAAGIFLKHYLDIDNYNVSDAFINKDAERFFFELTTGNADKKYFYFNSREDKAVTGLETNIFNHTIVSSDPSQVAGLLAAQKGAVDNAVNKFNALLAGIK